MTTNDQMAHPAEQSLPAVRELQIRISLETILLVMIVALAFVLRLPDIDTLPLNNSESHEALAVFRALDEKAPGTRPISQNPLMFSANVLAMAIGGAENATVRFPTLLVSLAVICAPIAFRRWLGPSLTLIAVALLALSPVLLVASRTMSGSVWSMALAMIATWYGLRYYQTHRATSAVIATIALVLLAVAAEPAGFLTLIGLLVGLIYAAAKPATVDAPAEENLAATPQRANPLFDMLRGWPWIQGLLLSGLTLIIVGSVFLLYPSGLSTIGESIGAGLRGILQRPEGYPALYPLLISVIYEPMFWIFGLTGAFFVLYDSQLNASPERRFIGRVLIGWLAASVVLSLLYAGAMPGHALWLTIPLIGLSAFAIERVLSPVRDLFVYVPNWGPWVHGLAVGASLSIAAIHLLVVGRAALRVLPAFAPEFQQPDTMKLLMVGLAILLTVITFFLVSSIWGARGAWHGLGIGLLIVTSLYTLNNGWQSAVIHADDPRDLWHVNAPSRNLSLIYGTVRAASLRATGEAHEVQITVVTPPGSPDDSPLMWTLRHFKNVTIVNGVSSELGTPIIIAPKDENQADPKSQPAFAQSYVGQSFATFMTFDRASITYWDFIPWLYDRSTRNPATGAGVMVLWLRSDVYGVGQPGSVPSLPSGGQ